MKKKIVKRDPPTHIGRVNSELTYCNIKKTNYPLVGVRFVIAHIQGYGITLCKECAMNCLEEGGLL